MQLDFGGGKDISFFKEGRTGIVRLTRPKVLNALNGKMVKALSKALHSWETDDDVLCVLIEGEGRAFCSGGDIVAAYKSGKAGKPDYHYFTEEYRLNAYIGEFPKPYIAILDGICMGGGAGISVHGSHRIVTENTIFSMPESSIGFFPDVGAGEFLPRLSDNFGIYLALTGEHLKWGDCLQTGLATHGVIPPIGQEQWQDEFEKYQQIAQYKLVNHGMTLEQFKGIFWWEWAHRLLARLVGVIALFGLIWFWATKRIEKNILPQLIAVPVLIGIQGAIGWWMVASGLGASDLTSVSQYRLAIHLVTACIVVIFVTYVSRGLADYTEKPANRSIQRFAGWLVFMALFQIYLGALRSSRW